MSDLTYRDLLDKTLQVYKLQNNQDLTVTVAGYRILKTQFTIQLRTETGQIVFQHDLVNDSPVKWNNPLFEEASQAFDRYMVLEDMSNL